MTIPTAVLVERLRHLAERMPRPHDEDRYYSDRECKQLQFDIETVNAALAALEGSEHRRTVAASSIGHSRGGLE
jgi:hypothetical protein